MPKKYRVELTKTQREQLETLTSSGTIKVRKYKRARVLLLTDEALNMVEIELSVLSKQCLDRRIGDIDTLEREVLAWTDERNTKRATVHWQFTKDQARDKFSKFYPNKS